MKVNILGTEYEIKLKSPKEDPKLEGNWGYNDETTKEIVIDNLKDDADAEDLAKLDAFSLKVLRHEIIHCFFNESGLGECCEFARDEVLVDWIARQLPKIVKACEEAEEQFRRSQSPKPTLVDKLIEAETKREFILPKEQEEEKPKLILERLYTIKDLIINGLLDRKEKKTLCNILLKELLDGVYDTGLTTEGKKNEIEKAHLLKINVQEGVYDK